MLKDLVARFVNDELMPLEQKILARDAAGEGPLSFVREELEHLDARAKELGLWGLDAPAEFGGSDLPVTSMIGVNEELGRCSLIYRFPPDSPNLHMLMKVCSEEQKAEYLAPYARGEKRSAIAISEPGGGGDPASMRARAQRARGGWLINGRKIWVSGLDRADFVIVMAVTDPEKRARGGISAFLVDKGTPGFTILRRIPMIGGRTTFELAFDDCWVPESKLLGQEGNGYGPMQLRLSTRRVQIGAICVGRAKRALDMLVEWAPQRKTFGVPLSERQAIQWWMADAATKIHATRLMTYDAAEKVTRGEEARTEISMLKVFATEMATEIVDHAQQAFGAMGMTREMPFHLMAAQLRVMRIYEGPTEVHRMLVARHVLQRRF
ncbi:MAG: acyl-CoA dehydrogenase [Burkholderiales bacterium]|nr:acyl-CoA dehydrogenase [Burkholderiales bacterium]